MKVKAFLACTVIPLTSHANVFWQQNCIHTCIQVYCICVWVCSSGWTVLCAPDYRLAGDEKKRTHLCNDVFFRLWIICWQDVSCGSAGNLLMYYKTTILEIGFPQTTIIIIVSWTLGYTLYTLYTICIYILYILYILCVLYILDIYIYI